MALKLKTLPEAFTTSNRQDWATPWPFIEAVERQLGLKFTLDVCASAKSAKAQKFYTEEEDAFAQDWLVDSAGGDAWCNPPFKDMGRWAVRALSFSGLLDTVIMAPGNKTDQEFFHDVVLPHAEIWAVRRRVHFVDPETGKPPLRYDERKLEWVRSGNSQSSLLFHFGPKATPGRLRSFVWKD